MACRSFSALRIRAQRRRLLGWSEYCPKKGLPGRAFRALDAILGRWGCISGPGYSWSMSCGATIDVSCERG
eukprot:12318584-Alexandrium_andersonii.AAC.1